jgi:virginiamycin B lyase
MLLALLAVLPVLHLAPGIQPFGAVQSHGGLWVALYGDGKVAKVDLASGRIVKRVTVGPQPITVATGAGSLWVGNGGTNTLSRIDPRTAKVVKTVRVGSRPYGVAFGAGSLWVADLLSGTVSRVDPRTNRVVATIKAGTEPNGLVVAFGAVWVGDRLGNALLKIDPRTNRVVDRLALRKPDWVTPDGSSLWVSEEDGSVAQVDPESLRLVRRVAVGRNPLHTAVVGGALWVPNVDDSTISRIDRASGAVETVDGPSGAIAVTTTPGAVWVSGLAELWRFTQR